MTNFDEIIREKRKDVEKRKALYPYKLLEQSPFMRGPTVSLKKYLERKDLCGIIAEIKKASPSGGSLNPFISVEKLSIGYMQSGASALSILTEEPNFGGCLEDLKTARKFNFCPILRKDFIVDEYQLVEARSYGADVILLIAACLTKEEVKSLSRFAQTLNLEVLIEIHEESELYSHVSDGTDLVGINNRNLKTLEVSIDHSLRLFECIPKEKMPITESGIASPESYLKLKKAGYKGFLIGEHFMKTSDPARALSHFVHRVKELCL